MFNMCENISFQLWSYGVRTLHCIFNLIVSGTLTSEDLQFHEKIGKGGHSTVFRATFRAGSYKGYTDAAVKTLHRQDEKEVEIMKKLKHKNIVAFLGYVHVCPNFLIVMERCRCSLWECLHEQQKKPLKALCQAWTYQTAEAIRYLHEHNIVHRDLRSKNCLLTADDILKVCDFGISKIAEETEDTINAAGCRPYIAPEVISEKKFSKASDIYALGFLLWEIHTKEIPKPIQYPGQGEEYLKDRHSIPDNWKALLRSCWEYNYHKRPKIEEVLCRLSASGQTLC